MDSQKKISRRGFLKDSACSSLAVSSVAAFPLVGCRKRGPLAIEFLTIPDPDGWHPSLRLKGDWLIIKITDGVLSGYGEASHSKQDEACRTVAAELFRTHLVHFELTLERLKELEQEVMATSPDLVTATAWSGINQALYDLLAKREQVPVWQLFRNQSGLERLSLYTTINRSLRSRTLDNYREVVGQVRDQGFKTFKCAPFDKVTEPDRGLEDSQDGLNTLAFLREQFPGLGMRVDFHERFQPEDFFQILPALEAVNLDWIEEPFVMGPDYTELRKRTQLRIAAGELFWGLPKFREIMENQWAHVIMPDVKHVGGFGPLLQVLEMAKGKMEISPHNPSGPVSTAASLHAAVLYPEIVQSLEFAFDGGKARAKYGERIEDGFLYRSDKPGWGIEVEGTI